MYIADTLYILSMWLDPILENCTTLLFQILSFVLHNSPLCISSWIWMHILYELFDVYCICILSHKSLRSWIILNASYCTPHDFRHNGCLRNNNVSVSIFTFILFPVFYAEFQKYYIFLCLPTLSFFLLLSLLFLFQSHDRIHLVNLYSLSLIS